MLQVKNLVKIYKSKKSDDVVALNKVSIDFPETGFVFLLGKSGSGKSTLLNSIGGLDKFDDGEIIIKGKSSKDFTQSDFDSYRNTFIGFIFQEYNILENFTVAKNLALALELQGKKANYEEVMKLLRQVEMQDYAKRKPNELSGGQKQRVAIARALIKNPEIIMADEPTGALDSNTGKQVMDTLKELSKTKLVIVVSHDREFAEVYGDRIIELKDGQILSDVSKKEVVATETSNGLKLIDNNILYIKKGKKVTDDEIKEIVKLINENSSNSDTFISVDPTANKKLKEGAKINDDGNKEKFLETDPEDINLKKYNSNSLKLIKSRLKLSDSIKMGASALKNKVGKLIFTIILSFFAFTVFGIVDALSCWNRASSVYQAMTLQNQRNLAFVKSTKEVTYVRDSSIPSSNLKKLQQEFPNHVIKGVATRYSGSDDAITLKDTVYTSTNNPLWEIGISGYISVTTEEIQKLGFDLIGRLPENNNEICISSHLYKALVKRTAENPDPTKIISENFAETYTDSNPLMVSINEFDRDHWYEFNIRIVGIVDDKTDLSTYEAMSDTDILKDESIDTVLQFGFTNIVYTTEEKHQEILSNSHVDIYYYLDFGFEYKTSFSMWDLGNMFSLEDYREYESRYYRENYHGWWNDNENRLYTQEEMEERFKDQELPKAPEPYSQDMYYADKEIITMKNGINYSNLAINEIIVPENTLKENIADYQAALDAGLTVKLVEDWDSDTAVREFKVVGVSKDYYYISKELNEDLSPLFTGYSYALSSLTGNDIEDRKFVNRLELFDEHNVRFTIQNATTEWLGMLESILLVMTSVFVWVALAFALFAALMLMNFISTSIAFKKREIGVLRALGARGSDIFGIFFNESLIISLINFVLASISTIVICTIINTTILAKLPIDLVLLNAGIRQMGLILGVSVLSAFIGSFIPTFKISRKRPIDAINNR